MQIQIDHANALVMVHGRITDGTRITIGYSDRVMVATGFEMNFRPNHDGWQCRTVLITGNAIKSDDTAGKQQGRRTYFLHDESTPAWVHAIVAAVMPTSPPPFTILGPVAIENPREDDS